MTNQHKKHQVFFFFHLRVLEATFCVGVKTKRPTRNPTCLWKNPVRGLRSSPPPPPFRKKKSSVRPNSFNPQDLDFESPILLKSFEMFKNIIIVQGLGREKSENRKSRKLYFSVTALSYLYLAFLIETQMAIKNTEINWLTSMAYLRIVGFIVVEVVAADGFPAAKNRHIWETVSFLQGVYIPNSLFAFACNNATWKRGSARMSTITLCFYPLCRDISKCNSKGSRHQRNCCEWYGMQNTIMIRFSALLPISAPFRISPLPPSANVFLLIRAPIPINEPIRISAPILILLVIVFTRAAPAFEDPFKDGAY